MHVNTYWSSIEYACTYILQQYQSCMYILQQYRPCIYIHIASVSTIHVHTYCSSIDHACTYTLQQYWSCSGLQCAELHSQYSQDPRPGRVNSFILWLEYGRLALAIASESQHNSWTKCSWQNLGSIKTYSHLVWSLSVSKLQRFSHQRSQPTVQVEKRFRSYW